MFRVPEQFRMTRSPNIFLNTTEEDGNNGCFMIKEKNVKDGKLFIAQASDGEGWEHVSVSLPLANPSRCPTWEEMCVIKNMFWDSEDVVIQFHPAEKDYVNNHPYCLHLWRPVGVVFPTPDPLMVGYRGFTFK